MGLEWQLGGSADSGDGTVSPLKSQSKGIGALPPTHLSQESWTDVPVYLHCQLSLVSGWVCPWCITLHVEGSPPDSLCLWFG